MTAAAASSARLPLCADLSRAAGEDPIGTAPHWQEVTVLELDVPMWARVRDVAGWTAEQAGVFERLRGKVEASGAGFGLLMSAPETPGAPLRVRHYALGPGGYARRDFTSDRPQDDWARGLTDTLLEPANLAGWTEVTPPAGPDWHVCTHGTVDAACGKYGVPVYQGLRAGSVRAWRTGHFGGHRFAATAVDLPAGLLWAHLTPDLALRVARRAVAPAEVRGHLRGFAGLPPVAQVVDRDLLVERGWAWLETPRRADVQADAEGWTVTLHHGASQAAGTVTARVTPAPGLKVPGSSHKPKWMDVKQYHVEWS